MVICIKSTPHRYLIFSFTYSCPCISQKRLSEEMVKQHFGKCIEAHNLAPNTWASTTESSKWHHSCRKSRAVNILHPKQQVYSNCYTLLHSRAGPVEVHCGKWSICSLEILELSLVFSQMLKTIRICQAFYNSVGCSFLDSWGSLVLHYRGG